MTSRLSSIDRVRGLAMVVMVLDHARDFYVGFRVDPTDLATTTPILFVTRWVTHFCAPAFIFLAGVSIYLQRSASSAPGTLQQFLLTRGLWLVFLEVTVIRFGWIPEPFYSFTLLQVMWVIGWSMILLAPLTLLPSRVVLALGVSGIALHGLLDPIVADDFTGPMRVLWAILHDPTMFVPAPGHRVMVGYSLLPWMSVMALGYGLGEIWSGDPSARQRRLVALGLGLIAAFVVVRGIDGYGDPEPWTQQGSLMMTVIAFLNCEKYPPSLDYLLMTLGPVMLVLAAMERPGVPASLARWLEVYGRVPLFFYIAHVYLLRPVGLAFAFGRFGMAAIDMDVHDGTPEWPLYAAYLAWLAALVILYPACVWFGALKRRRRDLWWLRYL